MQSLFLWIVCTLCLGISEAFFLFTEKQPILFCVKICPLYCSPRRHDEDASSLIYTDERPYYRYYEHSGLRYHSKEESTTQKPSTTETPYLFFYDYFDEEPYYLPYNRKPKMTTTEKSTTEKPTTTSEPPYVYPYYHNYHDLHSFYQEKPAMRKPTTTTETAYYFPDYYDDYVPSYRQICKPKPTPKLTTFKPTTTTEVSYFYPDHYVDHGLHPYFFHKPKPKPTTPKPTTTEMPKPTTEEPTWICMVCQKKCGYPPNNK